MLRVGLRRALAALVPPPGVQLLGAAAGAECRALAEVGAVGPRLFFAPQASSASTEGSAGGSGLAAGFGRPVLEVEGAKEEEEEEGGGGKAPRLRRRQTALPLEEEEDLSTLLVEHVQLLHEVKAEQEKKKMEARALAAEGGPDSAGEGAAADEAVGTTWREAMDQFWWGRGVRDDHALAALVRLGYKHAELRDPESVDARLARLQEVLPPGVAAADVVAATPHAVLVEPPVLERRLQWLAQLLPGQDLAGMLAAAPRIATTHTEKIKRNIQDLGDLLQQVDTFELLCREPGLLTADITGRVLNTVESLEDMLAGHHCDHIPTILAQPPLLLMSPACLAKRWAQLQCAADARDPWRRELDWAVREPTMVAFFLSRPEDVMERLEFLLEKELGQHLPLALVLSLPTAEFSDRCASYQAWCFEREHLAAGRRLSANEHRKPAHMWRVPARGGGRPEADPAARPDQA
eukprot:jgi/Tetstr1/440319/TSEL_028656.t1